MIWSSRERNRSCSLVSRRSRGRIAKSPAPSARARRITACDSRESSKSICKEIALQRPKTGKFDYLSGLNHPAHSMAFKFFTDDYVVLLGIFPLVLLPLRRHLALPVLVSAVIYLLTLHFGWQPHSYPDDEAWYFNPLAWQFLFVIGATAGYAPYSRQALTMPSAWLAKLAIGITVAVAIIHISWTIHGAYEAFPGLLLQELSPLVDDKANLAPLRLASFLALAVTAGHLVRRNNRLLHTPVARLIIRCGQHSLQVFCLGVLLAVLGEILLTSVRDDIAMQLAISLAGIVLMVAIGGLLTWYKEGNAMRSDAVIAADTNAAR